MIGPDDLRHPTPFRVGAWLVEPATNRLTSDERSLQIEPRLINVLWCLAQRPGEVVARGELLNTVWKDTVIAEEGLTVAISELRRALGDDPRRPHYIETIRKVGYRLVAPVSQPLSEEIGAFESWRSKRALVVAAFASVLVFLAGFAVWVKLHSFDASEPSALLPSTPFSSYPGYELYPALSPEGTRVAFSWNGHEPKNLDIYIKQANTDHSLRLTDDPAHERYPAWAPDGSMIAFHRGGPEAGIYTVAAIGGPTRRLTPLDSHIEGLDWSADGRWLVFSSAIDGGEYPQVIRLNLETMELKQLTHEEPGYACAVDPAFSPDSRFIAFTRSGTAFEQDVFVLPVAGGTLRRLTRSQRQVYGLDWTADGRHIIYAAAPRADFRLWRVALSDGSISWVPTVAGQILRPSISFAGDRIVYENHSGDDDIWRLSLDESGAFHRLIASTRSDFAAQYSPDGKQIAFISTRSGHRELWVSDADGRSCRQLTAFDGPYVVRPRWSPDGTQIAFSVLPEGYATLYVVGLDGPPPRPIFQIDRHIFMCRWSRDGEWLYYDRDEGDGWHLWRVRIDGSDAEAIVPDGYDMIYETHRGQILCGKRNDSGIWRFDLSTRKESCVVPGERMVKWGDVCATNEGIYHLLRGSSGRMVLWFYDFATGKSDSLAVVGGSSPNGLSLSPDRTTILCSMAEATGVDLIMVDGFR